MRRLRQRGSRLSKRPRPPGALYTAARRQWGGLQEETDMIGYVTLGTKDLPRAAAFYDALEISKGPSLGTNFSLVSPYTLLAHYNELDWAAERGAPRNLIRIWVGLEDPEDLEDRFARAFAAVAGV
jgi:cystathionine beta-lyase/cystathionine gamma-synthase